jgi:hypothetical protein
VAAGPITFSCNGDTTAPFAADPCNGLSYAVTFDGQFGPQQYYSLWIKTSTSYTGNATDAINAVALSGLESTFDGLHPALIMAPPGSTQDATPGGSAFYLFTTSELAAKGCKAMGTAGTNSLCADWIGAGYGVSVLPGHEYRWQFGFDKTGAYDPTVHIKYHFVQTTGPNAGKKVGSLGSWDAGVQVFQTPESATLPSLLAGLFCLAVIGRWR